MVVLVVEVDVEVGTVVVVHTVVVGASGQSPCFFLQVPPVSP